MKKINTGIPSQSQFLLYQSEDGKTKLEVRLENETVWLPQAIIAVGYGK